MAARDQKQMSLVVSEIRQETPEIKSIRLDLGANKPFSFRPGQFVILTSEVWNPKRNRMGTANRAFSLSSSPTEEDYIEIAAKRYPEGRLTPWLHDTVKVGDTLNVKGPEGNFVFTEGESEEIVLIAGGIGIAPYRSMIRYILAKKLPVRVTLLYSARTSEDFAFKAEFDAAMKMHPNLNCTYTVTRPDKTSWTGRIGRFDEAFLKNHIGPIGTLYCLCGPDRMIKECGQILTNLGVPFPLIRSERW
ncbi:MAG TPA: FAD-binding oxidoreductase [Nitrospiria bacterium]|jgi:ferredoxin-NADP reductase|nr:FAD-binding oxidoreductase [Nitrospiria bacterium]